MYSLNLKAAKNLIGLIKRSRTIRKEMILEISSSEVFNASLKLELKQYLSQDFGFKVNPYIKILGYDVSFIELQTLCYLFQEIFVEQSYYFKAKKENPLIIDCGSNIGISILYFKKLYPNARIISFEPFDRAFSILLENINNNNLQNITALNYGLSNHNGQGNLFFDPQKPTSLSMSFFEERIKGNSQVAKTICLSSYIDQPVDFVKMDIEGAELVVIDELSQTNKLSLIKEMIIEYHHHIQRDLDCFSHLLKTLEKNNFGYQIRAISDKFNLKNSFQDIHIYAYNKIISNE